jgi:hypothetical protein
MLIADDSLSLRLPSRDAMLSHDDEEAACFFFKIFQTDR